MTTTTLETAVDERPRTPERSDHDVIATVLAGDRRAFAELVRRYNQTLYRTCRAILRDDVEAEDAVQCAWTSAFRALSTFREDSSFRTWATRIAVNEASSRSRRRRFALVLPLDDYEADDAGPEQVASDNELTRLLEKEIDAMPEALREVLVLRDVVELDTAETAAVLGITSDNVRIRLRRARETLAHRVSEQAGVALPSVWRFAGERCARVLAYVMLALGVAPRAQSQPL
jgi:RNA polymerase sigma-70 factor, ECF subfamily